LALDHDGLDQKLDQVLEDIKNLVVRTPCGAGTEGERFVVDGPKVCDNTTGVYWEQSPSTAIFAGPAQASPNATDHCATLNLGNGQVYRLPLVKELFSLQDYGVVRQATTLNTPPNGPFNNVQLNPYWSAETVLADPSHAWTVGFSSGGIQSRLGNGFAWCVR
jgi:hypothetical protein